MRIPTYGFGAMKRNCMILLVSVRPSFYKHFNCLPALKSGTPSDFRILGDILTLEIKQLNLSIKLPKP